MSEILKEEQWQRRRAAKLQRVSQPRARQDARLLLLRSQTDVAPKAKLPKKGPAAPAEPTASAKQLKSQPEKPERFPGTPPRTRRLSR